MVPLSEDEKGMPWNPATVPAAVNEFAPANVLPHTVTTGSEY